MKFKKLSLDESLFDDSAEELMSLSIPQSIYDDEFVGTDLPSSVLEGPKSGSDAGVTDLLISAINDEWKTVSAYNSIIETLRYESSNNPDYARFIDVINDINAEENKHIGQLQEILQKLSPNAEYIDQGREEGRNQFNFRNGQLQVQSWNADNNSAAASVCGEDMCTITDVDDEM